MEAELNLDDYIFTIALCVSNLQSSSPHTYSDPCHSLTICLSLIYTLTLSFSLYSLSPSLSLLFSVFLSLFFLLFFSAFLSLSLSFSFSVSPSLSLLLFTLFPFLSLYLINSPTRFSPLHTDSSSNSPSFSIAHDSLFISLSLSPPPPKRWLFSVIWTPNRKPHPYQL